MNKTRGLSAVLSVLVLTAAFSWPGQGEKGSKESKEVPSAAASTDEEADVRERPELPQIPKAPKPAAVPDIPRVYKPVPAVPDIQALQKQIQEIIALNENLKLRYRGQVAEIQKISEQARIHQRMLQQFAHANVKAPYRAEDVKTILEQEKIRLIQVQTRENQNFIRNLEQGSPRTEENFQSAAA